MKSFIQGVSELTNLDYWLWLTLKENTWSNRITRVLELFDSPEQIYKMSEKKLRGIKDLTGDDVKLLSDKSMEYVENVKEQCKMNGIKILTYDSSLYPEKLRQIPDPPYVLYVLSKKRINLNNMPCIAMVGNRLMTEYGRGVAIDISRNLAAAGVAVISGMARGIDGASHIGALRAGGVTVAVLGCGLDVLYPPEHAELMDAICENGMVISEYPPGTPPAAKHFPIRNRIISGISDGVVVVEAPENSGALITAEYALEQGRDVFAVPGDITRGHSVGTNNLIRQGAILVRSAIDILTEYKDVYINTLKQCINNSEEGYINEKVTDNNEPDIFTDERFNGLSEISKKIISNLTLNPVHFDVLLKLTNMSADELSSELVMLEIGGFVKTLPGKNFILNA